MSKDNKKIFISYRRNASQYFARSVFMHLDKEGYNAFFDIVSVASGEFENIILNQIKARAHFLAILAPGSMERLKNRNDWLRKEIICALDEKRNVIPVLHGGFDFAVHGKQLTGKLAKLKELQALRIHDDYFNEGMDRLVNRYLQQPFYGEIAETTEEDQPEVTRKIVEAQEGEKPTEDDLSAEEYFNFGADALVPEEKLKYYTLAIERNIDYASAYVNRGFAHSDMDQPELAIEDYNKAIELDPGIASPYVNRGIAYGDLGQHELAIEDYNKAIVLDPGIANAYVNRGNTYGELGQHERAIEDYNKAIALNPGIASAYVNRGNTYRELGQHKRAIENYNKAIELDPGIASAYNNRAVVYSTLKEYDKALVDIEQALKNDSTNETIKKFLSEISRNLGGDITNE